MQVELPGQWHGFLTVEKYKQKREEKSHDQNFLKDKLFFFFCLYSSTGFLNVFSFKSLLVYRMKYYPMV
jgi:hypothetical protein